MTLGQMTASKRWRTAGDDRTSPAKPPAPHRPHGPLPCEIALEPPSSFAASTLQATHPNSHELAKFFLDIDDRLGLPELAVQLLHLTLELRDPSRQRINLLDFAASPFWLQR